MSSTISPSTYVDVADQRAAASAVPCVTAASSPTDAAPVSKRILAGQGFWKFLLGDFVVFGALLPASAVLAKVTSGAAGEPLWSSQGSVAIQTVCLLLSGYTSGLMSLALNSRRNVWFYLAAIITFALGTAFLGLEIRELAVLVARGGAQNSAFLAELFTVVACHGFQVLVGLICLLVVLAQVAIQGSREAMTRRVLRFSLFWQVLVAIWVAVLTNLYLMGGRA